MVVGEFTTETDLAIIGGGPGGYTAAFRAAELGVRALIIDDREELGGVCLHAGCIPSKTLLHIAEITRCGEHAAQFGVAFDRPRVDLEQVRAWVGKTRSTLAKALASQAKKHGVDIVKGRASFEGSRQLNVRDSDTPRIRFRRAIVATGATPRPHEVLNFDGRLVLSAAEAMEMPRNRLGEPPCHVLIVGHNYNAIELACIYSALGSAVTLVDTCDHMLPEADRDLARPLLNHLKKRLEHIACGVSVTNAFLAPGTPGTTGTPGTSGTSGTSGTPGSRGAARGESLAVTFSGEQAPMRTEFDFVIVASQGMANIEGLGLERTAVAVAPDDEGGFIRVDDQMRTTDSRVFAVGDVAGPPLLADHAMLQGRVAAEVVAGWNSSVDRRAVAHVIFTDPQLAWCGVTETQAKTDGLAHEVIKIPWGASGRAVGMGRTDGVTKIIYEPDTKLVLGVGISGAGAAELIAEGVLAIEMGAVLEDLAGAVHPHPTLSELISSAAHHVVETE